MGFGSKKSSSTVINESQEIAFNNVDYGDGGGGGGDEGVRQNPDHRRFVVIRG